MSAPSTPLAPGRDEVRAVRATLDEAGYSLDGVLGALGVTEIRALERLPWETVQLRLGNDPLETLIRLFMLGSEAPIEDAARALAPVALESWAALGLVEMSGERVRAPFRVVPDEELMLASDWPGSAERPLPPDHVLGHNPTAGLLDNVTIRGEVGSLLDVGTGCGVQALVGARHAASVTGTDLNPRAIGFARFNALLNDIEAEFLEGDLFEPVAGRTFDRIVANPPFVISPVQDYLFRDSALGGEGIVRRIVAAAPGMLNEGGICQLLCNLPHLEGEDFVERVGSAFSLPGCETWVVATDEVDPAIYASNWVRSVEFEPEGFKRVLSEWADYYSREGITAITWAIVTIRKTGGEGWFRLTDQPGAIEERSGEHLLRCLDGHSLLERTSPDGLLELTPKVAEAARLVQTFAPDPDGWAAVASRLATHEGLPTAGGVDPHVANLLIRCDGEATVREVLERTAADAGIPFDQLRPEGLKIVSRLFEGGYLTVP